jgi:3-oxoacyl-[acyl-carrier protein] reductase
MSDSAHRRTAEDLFGLDGKRGIVVGAGLGIGLATARALSARGMTLALVEREADRLSGACAELSAYGVNADVTVPGAARRALGEAAAAIGPIDVLVNIVGRGRQIPAIDQTADDQLEQLQVNYLHHVEFCSAFARACVDDERPGVMTLVSSLAGVIPFPQRAGYGAAKAALNSLVASLAVELGPQSIRVNAVAPGIVDTDRSSVSPEAAERYANAIPLRRVATQEEVARVVLFLCSDLSTYLTGQTVIVDGGASLLTKMWPS